MGSVVSIIIPTYNRARLLTMTLESVKQQSFVNWECIIVDDYSTDNTKEVVDSFILSDNRFSYYKRPKLNPKGANACRNYGFTIAKGDFIKFLDSDDLLLRDSVNGQCDDLIKNKELDMTCGYVRFFKIDIKNSWEMKPEIMNSNDPLLDFVTSKLVFHTTGPLWRVNFLKKQDVLFDEEMHKLQDTEFHYRMLLAGLNFEFRDNAIAYYRRDSSHSITKDNGLRNLISVFRYKELVFNTFNHSNLIILNNTRRLIANNVSILSHKIISSNSNIIERWNAMQLIHTRLFRILNHIKIPISLRIRINLGIGLTILTGRGLKYFRV